MWSGQGIVCARLELNPMVEEVLGRTQSKRCLFHFRLFPRERTKTKLGVEVRKMVVAHHDSLHSNSKIKYSEKKKLADYRLFRSRTCPLLSRSLLVFNRNILCCLIELFSSLDTQATERIREEPTSPFQCWYHEGIAVSNKANLEFNSSKDE